MKKTFEPILSILPEAQLALLPELKPTVDLGFVLYGGTAIALRLGHRKSIDFDFFSDKILDKELLIRRMSFLSAATVLHETPNSLTVLSGKNREHQVKLSFFGTIDFGRVGVPELISEEQLRIASLLDLFASKLKVVLQRIELKDYLDIAEILRSGVELERGLGAAKALSGSRFQPSECLKALVYFEGGDLEELNDVDRDYLIKSVSNVRELVEIGKLSESLV